MSSQPANFSGLSTFVYDARKPGAQPVPAAAPGPDQGPAPALTRTIEFRLSGSEESEQAVDLPNIDLQRAIVVANNVRVYVSGSGQAPAGGGIGSAGWRSGTSIQPPIPGSEQATS